MWKLRPLLAAAVAAMAFAMPATAGINPQDQIITQRVSLKLRDFEPGWRSVAPKSTKIRRSTCASAPKIDAAITGFSDSALFRGPVSEGEEQAVSTARAFASVPHAKTWYNWSGGGKLAQCRQLEASKVWADQGWKVGQLRRVRESFPLILTCTTCPQYTLRAWRVSRTMTKPGDSFTEYDDVVVVRMSHVVVTFIFSAFDSEFVAADIAASRVIGRAFP